MADRWQQIETLYHRALEFPEAERAGFLDAVCANDPELKREVASLLLNSSSQSESQFSPAIEVHARVMAREISSIREGEQLGGYVILGLLGRGGMGEVYRARDVKLGREVAVKILPSSFISDPDRERRFNREARLLATLNHPNIATIYGVEEVSGSKMLILELIEGETLAEKLRRGAMPVKDALATALQIIAALESAHEKGVIHRDLKPANIKVTPDGRVKVLDFGLAKAFGSPAEQAALEDSPTMSLGATLPGVIMGTAAYMAPEQARGLPVDRRADIFAFGAVLYEMLTGGRPFEGDSVADVLSQVLQREPDWSKVPSSVGPSINRLLRLCLEKDPRMRRQDAGDVRIDLEQARLDPSEILPAGTARPSRFSSLMWIGVPAVMLALLAIPTWTHLRETPAEELRLQVVTPPTLDPQDFALSPDGRYLVYAASEDSSNSHPRLYLRALENTDAQPIAGTDGAQFPFWSPDSRSIGFFASGKVLRIDATGGPPQPLAPAGVPLGGTWNADGTILFTPNSVSPVFRIPSDGGKSVPATVLESPRQNNHREPSFLPNGRQFLFYAPGDSEVSGIFLGSLDGTPPKRLTAATSPGQYLAPDHLVYLQNGALVTRNLDAARGELTGDLTTLASPTDANNPITAFSISANGILAYRTGSGAPRHLTRFDHQGKVLETLGNFNGPDLSFDGHYLAFDRTDRGGNRDVWLLDLIRGGLTPFTFHPNVDGYPIWSPDATRIAFESNRNGTFDLWIKPLNGVAESEELLYEGPENEWPLDWSSDGRFLLYTRTDEYYVSSDLLALPMSVENPQPIMVANTAFEERRGEFSPDARWVAYDTDESGRAEVVVQAFPKPNGTVSVSTEGGSAPRWSADGRELYFIAPDGEFMAVRVASANGGLTVGKPVALFPTQTANLIFKHEYVVTRDGQFLVLDREAQQFSPITLILNWKP